MDINRQNLESIFDIMVDFEEVAKVLRRLKNTRLSLEFQRYRSVLLDLEKRFEVDQSQFKSKIQQLLPKMRAQKANPTELTNLLEEYNKSPYEKETFLALLSARQKEIETAEFIIFNPKLVSNEVITKMY